MVRMGVVVVMVVVESGKDCHGDGGDGYGDGVQRRGVGGGRDIGSLGRGLW